MDTSSNTNPSSNTAGAGTAGPANGTNGTNGNASANTQKVVDRLAQKAHDTVDRVASMAGPAVDKIRSGASVAGETIQSKADRLGALEEQWLSSARSYVRDHPFTAVTIGVLAGIVIGRLGAGRSD